MAEVTQRTGGGTGLSRRGKKATAVSYDLSSWQGLTAVLHTARQSNLSDTDYSYFRDLVLAYAQSGGDAKLKGEIIETLESIGGEVKTASVDVEEPSFSPSRARIQATEAVSAVSGSGQVQTKQRVHRSRPQPRFVIPRGRDPVGASPQKSDFVQNVQKSARQDTVASPMVETKEVAHEVSKQSSDTADFKTLEDYKRRIAEIKHDVNVRVGNPMSLVDANNNIGREYMRALLTALKAGGGGGNIDGAMEKLEDLYIKVIEFHQEREAMKAATVAQEIENEKVSEEVPTPSSPDIPEKIEDVEEALPVHSESEITEVPESAPRESPISVVTDEVSVLPPLDEIAEVPHLEVARDADFQYESENIVPVPLPKEEIHDEVPVAPSVDEGIVATEQINDELRTEVAHTPEPRVAEASPPVVLVAPKDVVQSSVAEAQAVPPPLEEELIPTEESPEIKLEKLRARLSEVEKATTSASVSKKVSYREKERESTLKEEPRVTSSFTPKRAPVELQTLKDRLAELHSMPSSGEKLQPIRKEQIPQKQKDTQQSKGLLSVSHNNRRTLPSIGRPLQSNSDELEARNLANATIAGQVDLESREVTTALAELLSEWSLFQKSGFFGIGPSGLEHPLFEQLSKLPMTSVLSGRFEHATPEILQSVKDYVVAWQHEQGVTYLQSETFEHYLRRVVARILKRKNQ